MSQTDKSTTPTNSNTQGDGKILESNASEGYTATSHAKMEINQISQQVTGIQAAQEKIDNNQHASSSDKTTATALNMAEGGIQAFGAVTSLTTKVSESVIMPIMQKLAAFKGTATLPVTKLMDPVYGIDVHMVTIPPSPAPVPMPHLYAGMMFRLLDYVSCEALELIPVPAEVPEVDEEGESGKVVTLGEANDAKAKNLAHTVATMAVSMLGASVKIGNIPRAVAGTPSRMIPHIPMGAGFHPVYSRMVSKDHGHALLGSLFVVADGSPLTGAPPHMHNNCWDVGVFSIHNTTPNRNADKKPVFPAHLYVPSGMITPIPSGKPVITNMIPAPINPLTVGTRLFKAGLGKLRRKNEKILKKLSDKSKSNGKNPNLKCKFFTAVSKLIGTGTSHPADVASGNFYTDNVDFILPGIIPIEWERTYYSYSEYDGPLGTGWHHTYDMALDISDEEEMITLRMHDGRLTGFALLDVGESYFNRKEKLWLHRETENSYYLTDLTGLIYRFTSKVYSNPFNKSNANLLQSISNRNGYSIRFEYDRDGILNRITDTAGRIIRFETDGKGHISAVHLPSPDEGKQTFVASSYTYDSHGRLSSQTDALGNTMYFKYEGTLMVEEVWRNGVTWKIRYNKSTSDAKCLEICGSGGLFYHKLNYVAPDCTEVTNSLGEKTVYYHRFGLVTKRVEPNGGEYDFRYNRYNELEWTTDPLGNMNGEIHDDTGNLISVTAADGGYTQLSYDNSVFSYLPTSATDSVGGRWSWVYDAQGNLIRRIDPMKAETLFEYTDGLLTVITGAQGQQTKLFYDTWGNLREVVSPDGGQNVWRYDILGQCVYYKNAREGVTEYQYNLLGDVTKVIEPDGNIRELDYDSEGNVIAAKDKDRLVTFTYKGVNKLASRTEKGATLRFVYDTEDQLRGVVNEVGERYVFKLDAQGDVVEETGFDGLTRRYRRDLGGQVTSVLRPNGDETVYEYDQVGRVTKVVYNPDSKSSEVEVYEYRKDGSLTKAVNRAAEVVLDRDVLGRVVREVCNGQEVTSRYDIGGNRTHIGSSLGADIEAEYNLMGDLMGLQTDDWRSEYRRDRFGLEVGRLMSGNVSSVTQRDRIGRVTGHAVERNGKGVSSKAYLWGVNDKLLSINDNGKVTDFQYDTWGNLAKTVFPDGKVELRNPDKAGNLFESLDRMDRKYAKGGQLVKTELWDYKYDREGNLVQKRDKKGVTWKYFWNQSGMLECVLRPDGRSVSFRYDALGRRVEKHFIHTVTKWLWDGNVPLHEWREVHTKCYEKDRGEFIEIDTQPVTTWVFEEGSFVPAAKLTQKRKLSIVTDYLGTPEAMFDELGEKTWSCRLNSYGKVRNFEGEHKLDCPFRYQGQYEDYETGLYYNRFRYYDPNSGSYISQDPIGVQGGIQLYSYVHDTNGWIDAFGLNEINDLGKIGEINAGIKKNTTRIPSASRKTDYRIPDAMTKNQRHIKEVKNVDYQYFSSQIKDDLAHVNRGGKKGVVTLIVDKRTKLSPQLQAEIDAGRIKLKRKDLNKKVGCHH